MKTEEIIKNLIREFSTDNSNHFTSRKNIVKCLRALNISVYERNAVLKDLEEDGEIEPFENKEDETFYGLIEHESQKGRFIDYYNAY